MNSAVKETERKRLNELSGKVIGLCIEARKKMNHRGTKNTEIRRLASSADLAPASVPKFVVSSILQKAEWNNSTLIKENVAEEISKLKQQPGGKHWNYWQCHTRPIADAS